MKYAMGIPSYLRCPKCGHAMKGEVSRDNFARFTVQCGTLRCEEYEIKYETDAVSYPLRKVE